MMKNKKNQVLIALRLSVFLKLILLLVACSSGGSESEPLSVNVSGTIQYEDKEYSNNGFTGNTDYKTVRYAVVELVDYNNEIVASTVTDDNGYYELLGGGHDLRIRVLSQLDSSAGATVSINDYSGNLYSAVYNIDADKLAENENRIDINIDVEADIVGAFNMLDVYESATEFVRELSNAPMPELNVYWENKNSRYGTYYCFTSRTSTSCPHGRGIYILGGRSTGSGDTDHFDDDVLLHEYAHYLESMVGAQDSPGGTHYLTENDQDLRLTWSEGLGGFFPVAVKTWLKENHPERLSTTTGLATTYFIDTYGSYVGISMDLNNPAAYYCYGSSSSSCFSYSSSEIAVAKILIGVMNEFGTQAVWDVYSNYMATGTVLPATLETFWDGWMLQRVPSAGEYTNIKTVFNERQVYYEQDNFESDNDIGVYRKLASCVTDTCYGETHFLYQEDLSGDRDLVAFDAQAGMIYLVETINLSNAADTYLRILDASGNVVFDVTGAMMVNDNRPGTVFCGTNDDPCRVHNDDLMLSSELYFNPAEDGTYYAEVTTSASRPAGSGRYGTYTLQITY